ncbi:MAG: hypothetical protein R6X13_09415 [bacterium]
MVLDIANPAHPVLVGEPMRTRGRVCGAWLDSGLSRLYVSLLNTGLEIWSVADPQSPARMGTWTGRGVVEAVAVGAHCYVLLDSGVVVLDVSNPVDPHALGHCAIEDECVAMAIADGLAVVGTDEGLEVVDVTQPTAPYIVGRLVTDVAVEDLAVTSTYACLASGVKLKVVSVSEPTNPWLVGELDLESPPLSVAASGADVYLGADDGSVTLVSISDPTAPALLDQIIGLDAAEDVVLAGTLVCVAQRRHGLAVLEFSNTGGPRFIGRTRVFDTPYSIDAGGGFIYVADGDCGLTVVDVRLPASPEVVGYCLLDGGAVDVAVRGSLAYVADDYEGLKVVSIAQPENPWEVGTTEGLDAVQAVALSGSGRFAYVYDWFEGFVVVQVVLPSRPIVRGRLSLSEQDVDEMAVFGDYCLLAAGQSGLYVVCVADPLNPVKVARLDGFDAWSVVVDDSSHTAWLGSSGSVVSVDISDPTRPSIVGTVQVGRDDVTGIALYEGIAVAVSDDGSMVLLDITNRALPLVRMAVPVPEGDLPIAVLVTDSVACLATFEGNLFTVSSLHQTVSRFVGSYAACDPSLAVEVAGGYAYIAARFDGLRVLDISDRSAPREAARLHPGDRVTGLRVTGGMAYLAADDMGLVIVDVSEPSSPQVVGRLNQVSVHGITIVDTLAFLSSADNFMAVANVADPARPVLLGQLYLADDANEIAVSGHYAYVAADDRGGLVVVDVSDPANPRFVDSIETRDKALGVTLAGDVAYVADEDAGLTLVDISNPTSIRLLGSLPLPADADKVRVSGSRAVIACESHGVSVIDVADTANLREIAWFDTPGSAYDVALDLPYLVAADYYCGVAVLELLPIGLTEEVRSDVAREPMATVVRGVLRLGSGLAAVGQKPDMGLFDATGRRVLDLKPGENNVSGLAPGVYFMRRASNVKREASSVTKVIVTR